MIDMYIAEGDKSGRGNLEKLEVFAELERKVQTIMMSFSS